MLTSPSIFSRLVWRIECVSSKVVSMTMTMLLNSLCFLLLGGYCITLFKFSLFAWQKNQFDFPGWLCWEWLHETFSSRLAGISLLEGQTDRLGSRVIAKHFIGKSSNVMRTWPTLTDFSYVITLSLHKNSNSLSYSFVLLQC